jgi:glutathione transport system substrate-binding protein
MGTESPEADSSRTLRVGVAEGPAAARSMATQFVHEGLTRITLDGRAQPALAESWQWEAAGRRLRLFLRPNVRFHDQTRLTSAVAEEALREAVRREGALYPSLGDIAAIHTDGPLQLVLDLSRPSAFLPEDLSVLLRMKNPDIGTGPYRFIRTSPDEVVMESFREYYLGRPGVERIVFKPYDTPRTTWSTFLRGELDMVSDVPQNTVEFIRSNDVQIISFVRWYQFVIAYNSRRAPFDSPLVRRALNVAIDRDLLIQRRLQGQAIPATSPIWPRHWAYDSGVPSYGFDPGLAMDLLDQAGLSPGAARARAGQPEHMRLRFTCLIPSNFGVWEEVALELQRQLYDVGVDMQFDVVSFAEYDRRMRAGEFETVFTDLISGPALSRPYIFWASASALDGLNVFGYENPKVERLFGELRSSVDESNVRSATRRLQWELMDDPPALFLTWSQRARAVRTDFRVVRETDRDPLMTLWRWTPASSATPAPSTE